ncbi:hypothetical protein BU14_0622s0005 [Porphyra umbilicalis]|uniref:Uncharacterized protein n=1 Tax=Porphyra umbilicalis TaxID=2786 RepID=A0A1X6NQX4_PORUM|nr:hypothetical protein BU14_0622s0005 [Porphyra umbilicalis]|eukprot:OSX70977.1 hypothetical protein BU14_0622s0005 [Porphyra umbilicalis]
MASPAPAGADAATELPVLMHAPLTAWPSPIDGGRTTRRWR